LIARDIFKDSEKVYLVPGKSSECVFLCSIKRVQYTWNLYSCSDHGLWVRSSISIKIVTNLF